MLLTAELTNGKGKEIKTLVNLPVVFVIYIARFGNSIILNVSHYLTDTKQQLSLRSNYPTIFESNVWFGSTFAVPYKERVKFLQKHLSQS